MYKEEEESMNEFFDNSNIKEISDNFHKLLYYKGVWRNNNTKWMGNGMKKNPLDCWIYQEILYETKPRFLIECGCGGSTNYFYDIGRMCNEDFEIIAIDINKTSIDKIKRKGVHKLLGNSIDLSILKEVNSIIGEETNNMVILDSDHSMNHVFAELRLYNKFVGNNNYLVVEDTNLNGHPVRPNHIFGKGPYEAVEKFLLRNKSFIIDKEKEKFYATFHPNGFLKRINK